MTVPCSLPVSVPGVAPSLPDAPTATPGATDATDDAFAAVLAALSGALGVPVSQLTVQGLDTPASAGVEPGGAAHVAGAGAWNAATQRQALPGIAPVDVEGAPATTGAVPTDELASPVAATPTGRAATAVASETGPVGPWHATHGTEVRATRPAAEHAPFARLGQDTDPAAGTTDELTTNAAAGQTEAPVPALDAEAPVVPVVEEATRAAAAPDAALAAQPVAPTTATTATASVDRPHEAGPAKHVQPAVLEAARGLRHEGGGRTSLVVRLDPPELGAVLVRLTVQDGRVDVQLRTPDLVARNDLQAQQYDVQQVLRDQGFDLSSFDVAHGDVFPGNQGDSPDRGTPQRSRRADGAMDDHHSVMDDGLAPEPSGTWL